MTNEYYRTCYENGDKTKDKIYEMYKYCKCEECRHKLEYKKDAPNKATATTKDILKLDEIAEFLNNWTCKQENSLIPSKQVLGITYFKF